MSILDTFVSVAKETGGYGTATTSSARAFESKNDDFQRDVEYIESVGFRKDMQTIRSDRHTTISTGATGSIEMDIQNKGLGLLLQGALTTATSPVQLGATSGYKSTYESGDALSSVSYTVQVGKADTAGSLQSFTYEGSQITGWSIGQELGNNASMTFNFDCENEQNSTALATPSYPASTTPFNWTNATIEIDDSAISTFTSFSLDADLAADTARRFLKGSATKSQPKMNGVPSYTGSISGEFAAMAQYEAFCNGTVMKIEFILTGSEIESPYNYVFHVTMPACKFTGSTPVASLDSLSSVDLPFIALDNGTDAAVKIEVTSTDTSF